MFVKIEVYLMNFYHIYQNYNYPLIRTAFNRVKLAASQNKIKTAAKVLQVMGRFKRSLGTLQQLEKRKESAALIKAFASIRDSSVLSTLAEQMRAAKVARVKKLKDLLQDKKDEIEYLNGQLADLLSKSKTRAEMSSGTKPRDLEGKSFELKKLQNKVKGCKDRY